VASAHGWSARGEGAVQRDQGNASAIAAFAAGTLSLLLLLATLQPLPPTPAGQLAFAASHRTAYALFATLVLAWSVVSVPSIVTSAAMLQRDGRTLATSATILSAAGVLLLGYGIFTHVGALLSIVAAGVPPHPDDATYQAAVWSSLRFYLTDPGLMTWGLGQFLLGRLAWRSGVLPNWVAVVGMVGGVAGLLTLAVYQTAALGLVQLLSFTIWCFATGVRLRRPR
jgi:hypothetical protein